MSEFEPTFAPLTEEQQRVLEQVRRQQRELSVKLAEEAIADIGRVQGDMENYGHIP